MLGASSDLHSHLAGDVPRGLPGQAYKPVSSDCLDACPRVLRGTAPSMALAGGLPWALLTTLCLAGSEACCGKPAGLCGRSREGGEIPSEVLEQAADPASPALVSDQPAVGDQPQQGWQSLGVVSAVGPLEQGGLV